MPCRMKNYFVTPAAYSVMGMQNGPVLIGIEPPALSLCRAEQPSQLRDSVSSPTRAFAMHSGHECLVCQKQVVVGQERYLVERLVLRRPGSLCLRIHAAIIFPSLRNKQ